MNCPVCKEPMVVLELEQVEIDYCLECSGIWLDAGELELLLESGAAKDEVLDSFISDNETKEKRISCPICLRKMVKVLCGKDKKVLIDKCRRNDGLWFDKNELYQILDLGGLGKDNKILKLLKDMLKWHLNKGGYSE